MLQKKICILGPTGVGKTSLVKQYVEGIFSEKYLTSIGVKIDKKRVDLSPTPVQMMLWDLEGIDKYCGFNPRYLRGAAAYIIVADQTRTTSLSEAMEIHSEARNHTDVPAILAINKSDLTASSTWDVAKVDAHSSVFHKRFITSAKSGEQVEDMFAFIAKTITD
ncbi:GTP-binding protein [Glaciecola sp. MH2013]|uniref:Rab family GTPase n=1 Tax=Glaciecola sp. MH2013 TaxID=2785524 RepID=UPI0018A106DE|nr:Rab family GTPase [Glaciecola sp. MH2013]MBF7074105.1 GTP-binding protein [Glaciecola sp. MH2013]